jgi:hypothetical protein
MVSYTISKGENMNIFDVDNFDEILNNALKGENPPMILVDDFSDSAETLSEAA